MSLVALTSHLRLSRSRSRSCSAVSYSRGSRTSLRGGGDSDRRCTWDADLERLLWYGVFRSRESRRLGERDRDRLLSPYLSRRSCSESDPSLRLSARFASLRARFSSFLALFSIFRLRRSSFSFNAMSSSPGGASPDGPITEPSSLISPLPLASTVFLVGANPLQHQQFSQ